MENAQWRDFYRVTRSDDKEEKNFNFKYEAENYFFSLAALTQRGKLLKITPLRINNLYREEVVNILD